MRFFIGDYFLNMVKMSFTQNRRGDFQGIKTREFVLQNNDLSGSFPPLDSILVVGDTKGGIKTTKDLSIPQASIELREVTTSSDSTGRYINIKNGGIDFKNKAGNIENPGEFSVNKDPVDGHFQIITTTTGKVNMNIDETGSMIMSGFSTTYNANDPSDSDIRVNGNIYALGSDSNGTGQVHTERIILPDNCSLWANSGRLLWKPASEVPVNVLGWQPLLNNNRLIDLLNGTTDLNRMSNKIDELIQLIANSRTLLTISGAPILPPAVTFQTAASITIQVSSLPLDFTGFDPSYTSITLLLSTLNSTLGKNIFIYDSQANIVSIDLRQDYPSVIFKDYSQKGAAQRMLNHLGLKDLIPTYGYVNITESVYGSALTETNIGYGRTWANPTSISGSQIGSRHITFTWGGATDGGGEPPRYGIYKGGNSYDIIDSKVAKINGTPTYSVYGLAPSTAYSFTVTTIGLYDESANTIFYNVSTTADIPINPTGISLTQFLSDGNVNNVIPLDPTTFGTPTGVVINTGLGLSVLPLDNGNNSYVYSSSFTMKFPDTYENVYIGVYANGGGSVDAYQLYVNGQTYGIWKKQTVDSPQYFGPITFLAGVEYPSRLVTMKINTSYSLGMFLIQIQPNFSPEILSDNISPTLDNLHTYLPNAYPQIPLMQFCTT